MVGPFGLPLGCAVMPSQTIVGSLVYGIPDSRATGVGERRHLPVNCLDRPSRHKVNASAARLAGNGGRSLARHRRRRSAIAAVALAKAGRRTTAALRP